MGKCAYCGSDAGFLRRKHRECESLHLMGRQRMVAMVADAAARPDFSEVALMSDLSTLAANSYVDDNGIRAVIAEGWHHAVKESLADGILTRAEESRLRDFREQLAIAKQEPAASLAARQLDRAVHDRVVLEARLVAISPNPGYDHFLELEANLDESLPSRAERRAALLQAWEAAVAGSLENGVLSLDEENALVRYMRHFYLSQSDLDRNGAYRNMVKSAIIREAAEGIVPNRLGKTVPHPFNLTKSEQLVWVVADVDYYEVKTRRQRQGSSHGLSIRVAKGIYYRPSIFQSQTVEWEETVHEDTGLLGVTSKHLYFHGSRCGFRIRYDRIVSFEPFTDGIGVMRDAQTAKPQSFRTGDGWFIYNLVVNLAQRQQ